MEEKYDLKPDAMADGFGEEGDEGDEVEADGEEESGAISSVFTGCFLVRWGKEVIFFGAWWGWCV